MCPNGHITLDKRNINFKQKHILSTFIVSILN
jgi:hypothetical protein